MEWIALYKFARIALLVLMLVAIGVWVYRSGAKDQMERPARRMMEDEEDEIR
jgi:cbb3-type cytochrome oxidase subunit 3